MKILVKSLLLMGALSTATTASALTAKQIVQKEVVTTNANGEQTITYTDADRITPGERILYRLDYANDQREAATNLVLTMPVPGEVVFADGTVTGGSDITYSVDGTEFKPRAVLTVVNEQGEARPASANDITHIRWKIAGPVAPGEVGSLAFTGTLK
ncbi:MAG: hypothetical protein HKN36_05160 [Hellea sp.]|nr:hypothetical protein [Hellea sp.]